MANNPPDDTPSPFLRPPAEIINQSSDSAEQQEPEQPKEAQEESVPQVDVSKPAMPEVKPSIPPTPVEPVPQSESSSDSMPVSASSPESSDQAATPKRDKIPAPNELDVKNEPSKTVEQPPEPKAPAIKFEPAISASPPESDLIQPADEKADSEPVLDNSLGEDSQLKEMKYDLDEMLNEVMHERHASSMARQIIDQEEIQKMLDDRKKKLQKQGK